MLRPRIAVLVRLRLRVAQTIRLKESQACTSWGDTTRQGGYPEAQTDTRPLYAKDLV